MPDHPGLGRAGIHVSESETGAVFQLLVGWRFRVVQLQGVAHRRTIGSKIHDHEVILGSQGPGWVGKSPAGGIDVGLPADQGPTPEFCMISLGERWKKVLPVGALFRLQPCGSKEGGRQVNEGNRLGNDLPRLDVARPAGGEEDPGPEVIAIGFAAGESRSSVISGNDKEGVVQFPDLLQFIDDFPTTSVKGHALSEIVRQVFTHFMHVGEKGG